MTVLPTLFVSHGAPDVAVAAIPANSFLRALGKSLPKPEAIIVASAHFEAEDEVLVTGDVRPETIYDFGGFDPRLREMRYEAPGSPELANAIVRQVASAGFETRIATNRGYDHGTWVPLILAYPEADVPVVQISVDPSKGAEHHEALGRALKPLREDGVLVIGSGSFTHNLREAFVHVRSGERDAATPDWVSGFSDWMSDRIVEGDREALLDYRERAPAAERNHPTQEHLMPLYVAMGAAGETVRGRRLHDSQDFGVLAMAAFAFS